ncbi:MAG: hypothetical protein Q7T01_02545 [bacterium]|nr:hypothetical protein [bacterium]
MRARMAHEGGRSGMSTKQELILGGVAVAVMVVVSAWWYMEFEYAHAKAESELTEYLADMYPDHAIPGKQCTRRDTDGDGYISCDARVQNANGAEEKLTVECASTFFNSGCKTKSMFPVGAPAAPFTR